MTNVVFAIVVAALIALATVFALADVNELTLISTAGACDSAQC
jgi:hypothetical protein